VPPGHRGLLGHQTLPEPFTRVAIEAERLSTSSREFSCIDRRPHQTAVGVRAGCQQEVPDFVGDRTT
jgi:hypothetical protein